MGLVDASSWRTSRLERRADVPKGRRLHLSSLSFFYGNCMVDIWFWIWTLRLSILQRFFSFENLTIAKISSIPHK